jgi:DNA-binding HxlR family transcriptional regulator
MPVSYGQFCPVAKASEIFATRWTPLVLRELMSGKHTFNDIHRGLPLISRAVLVARLRELERHGVIERRPRAAGTSHEYWLTPAGVAFQSVVGALGDWGLTYTRDRITRADLDPSLLMWGLHRRADASALPDRRVVVRFEFSGVPASRAKFRIMWLMFERSGAQVCVKDPGFAVDLILRGNIGDYVAVYLGHSVWRDVVGKALFLEGDRQIAKQLPVWLQFGKVNGRNSPGLRSAARPIPSSATR